MQITPRDFLAGNAPVEPQFWFRPIVAIEPPAPLTAEEFGFSHALLTKLAKDWCSDSCFDLAQDDAEFISAADRNKLSMFQHEWEAYWDSHAAWKLECDKQRLVQWPYAWADAVIAAAVSK